MTAVFRQEGESIRWTNGTGDTVVAGTVIELDNGLIGLVQTDTLDGATSSIRVTGIWLIEKDDPTLVVALGEFVDIDFSGGGQVIAAVADTLHRAAEPTASGDTKMYVLVNQPFIPSA